MEIVTLLPPEKSDMGMSFRYNGKECYRFTLDVDNFDEIVEWLFENTKNRFVFLGTDRVYFENNSDAMAFKLRWL